MLSHELRNPLSAIFSALHFLRLQGSDDSGNENGNDSDGGGADTSDDGDGDSDSDSDSDE